MKVLKIIGWVLLALIVIVAIWAYSNMRDKNSGYTLDMTIEAKQNNPLKVGFAALTITPQYFEYWHDADNNARYEPKKGDTYEDSNNNGRFDTYWIAGFGNRVATNGVHDDIWARTMVIDDGNARLAIVALDVIGFFHPMVIEIRNMLPPEAGITYLSMSATHTHEAPDLMGLWGESPFKNGVDKDWREYVKERVVQSVVEAVNAMRPATLKFSQNLTDGMVTLTDTREPYVYDHGLRMMQAIDKENGETLGTLIQWANHPETLWSRNLQITSDFPHFIREAVEKGVYHDETLVEEGVGGVALYLNGAVGGLMTTHASTGVKDPFRDTTYVEPSYDKARAQGDTLGLLILRTMKTDPVEVEEAGINLRVKTFMLPLDNPVFRLAAAIGVMEADMVGWMKKRTEAAAWSIGPASFLTVPGEIYPEIVNGGIDALPGRDFEIDVQETPPLRALMGGEFRFVFGLTNDEVGYIIPKSQWDVKEPFVYRDKPYYGESNSLGCNTAPILYGELKRLLGELPGTEPFLSQASVPEVRDRVLERMIRQLPEAELNRLDHSFVLDFITPEEKKIVAGRHWVFTVDKSAVVSVMRHKEQETVPFWLEEKGFIHTGKEVKNDNFTYEVWQKEYPAGIIELGINGFDLHRTVYFVTIGPVKDGEMPVVSDVFPDKWARGTMRKGQFTYNDWDELVIKEYPADMEGHILFTTIRGRARESAFVNSFRATDYPSSSSPDQVVLTWSADPSRTQSVQWRTNTSVTGSYVKYWLSTSGDEVAKKQSASCRMLSDAYIHNDPKVYHWETTLSGLLPGQRYNYCIGTEKPSLETPVYSFRTAPGTPEPFRFFHLGDTHNKDIVKEVLHEASASYPDAAFLVHSGDHVNTGLFRDHWDQQFALGKGIFERIPYMPVLGNHDSQDGLPPVLYTQLFALPGDNSCGLSPERNYTFAYSNAQFFMIDVTGSVDYAACWLEKELSRSDRRWKIAVMHFPPYHADHSYTELREKWGVLFDKYEVDMVLSGHIHQYIRSYPIYNGEPVTKGGGGTYYVSSLAVDGGREKIPSEKYNEIYSDKGGLYQVIEINNNKLSFIAKDKDGNQIDRFEIVK